MINNQQLIFFAIAGIVLLILVFFVLSRVGGNPQEDLRNRMKASYMEVQELNRN